MTDMASNPIKPEGSTPVVSILSDFFNDYDIISSSINTVNTRRVNRF